MVTWRQVRMDLSLIHISYEFATEVVGGAVPKNFFPAVEKGIQESVGRGPLAAYPVVGVKAVLYLSLIHILPMRPASTKRTWHI